MKTPPVNWSRAWKSTGLEEEVTVKRQKDKRRKGKEIGNKAPMNKAYFHRDLACFLDLRQLGTAVQCNFFISIGSVFVILYN